MSNSVILNEYVAEFKQKAAELVELMQSPDYSAERAVCLSNDLEYLEREIKALLPTCTVCDGSCERCSGCSACKTTTED